MNKKGPLYQKVYFDLLDKINSNYYSIGSKLPTEKELGKEYNVSRITIISALQLLVEEGIVTRTSGKGTFATKKSQQVMNPTTKKKIGLLISGFTDSFGNKLLTSIENSVSTKSFSLIIKITNEKQHLEEEYVKELVDIGVDGIIVMPVQGEYYNPLLLKLVLRGFPIVIIDRKLEGIQSLFVGSDNFLSAKDAVSYITKKNHTNISVVMHSNLFNSSIKDRISGIKEGFAINNIVYDEKIWINNITSNYTYDCDSLEVQENISNIITHIKEYPYISCFLTLDHHCAELVYEAVYRLDKSIPNDYSLLSFDTPKSIISKTNFTHIKQDEQSIGEEAVNVLFKKIDASTLQNSSFIIPSQIVERGSVRTLKR
jgi:GntR family transcriptional regulator of arabinose operon